MKNEINIDNGLPVAVRGAIGSVLRDITRADTVAAAVLQALEDYEDEKFLSILKQKDEGDVAGVEDIQALLKS